MATGLTAVLAACGEGNDVVTPEPLNFTLTPERATIVAGDSVALTLRGEGTTAAQWALRWRSDRPSVVRLDTTVTAGRAVYARGGAPGEAMLEFQLSYRGQTVTGGVPVTVTAPPPRARFEGPAWEVVAFDGQALPRTVSVVGRGGACVDLSLYRSRVVFLADGTFEHLLELTPDSTAAPSVFRTSYTRLPDGTVRLSDASGSASIQGDTLRVRLENTLLCGRHDLVAVRGR